MEYKLEIKEKILPEEEKTIYNALLEYNLEHLEDKEPRDLGIYIRNDNREITAGLIGYTHGNWLIIKYLWVHECLRRQGIGSKLLMKAEAEAQNRKCKYVFLDTFSFQAPDFYKKHGYQERFVLENYPLTGKRFYYTKELA